MFFYNIRSLAVNWRRYVAVVAIIAVATGCFLMLATALDSFAALMQTSTERDNAVVITRGSQPWAAGSFPELGRIPPRLLSALSALPGVAQSPKGPLASPELVFTGGVKRGGKQARITVRGVGSMAFEVHRIVVGEVPTSGALVGPAVRELLPGIKVGDQVTFAGRDWPVAGFFSDRAGGTQFDSEIWVPLQELMQARQTSDYGIVYLKAKSARDIPDMMAVVNNAQTGDLAQFRVAPESLVNEGAEDILGAFHAVHVTFSMLLMGVAGLGTVNILLYNAFRRRRDMALMRALGTSGIMVGAGFVFEGLAIATVGSILGALLALTTSGYSIVAATITRPGVMVFKLHYRPELLVEAVFLGALIGTLCALIPAWYSSRYTIKDELRAD